MPQIPQMLKGAFNIPDAIADLFNRTFRREDAIYTRSEHPHNVQYTYGDYVYRGRVIKLIDRIVVEYESSKPTEVFTAEREGPDGVLTGSRRTIHFANPRELVAGSEELRPS